MARIAFESRRGSILLGVLGIGYVLAALVLLAWHLVQTWGAMGLSDWLIQAILAATCVVGVSFIRIALRNPALRRRTG